MGLVGLVFGNSKNLSMQYSLAKCNSYNQKVLALYNPQRVDKSFKRKRKKNKPTNCL